jgi:hypothetical protein
MKEVLSKSLIFVVFILLFSFYVVALQHDLDTKNVKASETGFSGFDNSAALTSNIESGEQASGSVPANTQVSPNGVDLTVSGQTETNAGKLFTEKLTIQNNILDNVKGFEATSDTAWTADFAEQIQSLDFLLLNAFGVKLENGILTAEHADSFLREGSITTNLDKLESKPSSFSVEKADSIVAGCLTFNNIEDSVFSIFNNAVQVNSEKGTS